MFDGARAPVETGVGRTRLDDGRLSEAVVVAGQSVRGSYLAEAGRRTDLETESWRLLREEWAADPAARAECEDWERRRSRVQPQMLRWLARFLKGNVGLEQFRATFDRRTRTDWDAFALKGASGAMFLNALVKHAEHPVRLARHLRTALRAPATVEAAADSLAEFAAAIAPPALPLDTSDASGKEPARPESSVAQPVHATFFATMCWHLQDADRWPAFQPSSRRVLHEEEELYTPTGDPVRDYLRFREAFLSLAAALSLTTWQLEHLCWWHAGRTPETAGDLVVYDESAPRRRRRVGGRSARNRVAPHLTTSGALRRPARTAVRETPPPYVPFLEPPLLDHTHMQWVLAKVGHQLGCEVWIAANDRHRRWGDEALGALSIPVLPPLGMSPDSQRVVGLIDVVWLTGVNQVAAAFEVEHTTSVYSGLLRMADLAALSPNLSFPLYVVAPAARLAKVRRELTRPTFRALGLDRRCRYFSSESLLRALPNLTRWATGPEAIEKLAEAAQADE